MGRGTGKGKKLTLSGYSEDPKSGGEELLPAYKRKNRPQKPLKDDIDEDAEQNEEGEDDLTLSALNEEVKVLTMVNAKKRKILSKAKEIPDLLETENGSGSKTKVHSTSSNSFRRIGSRRKSKPSRAAEAGTKRATLPGETSKERKSGGSPSKPTIKVPQDLHCSHSDLCDSSFCVD